MPDYRLYHRGATYIAHSAKGSSWKKHKYIKKIGDTYIYAKDELKKALGGNAEKDIERLRKEQQETQRNYNYAKSDFKRAEKRASEATRNQENKSIQTASRNVRAYTNKKLATAHDANLQKVNELNAAKARYNRSPLKAARTAKSTASNAAKNVKHTTSKTINNGKKALSSAAKKVGNMKVYEKTRTTPVPASRYGITSNKKTVNKVIGYDKVTVNDLVKKGQKSISKLFKKKKRR